VLAAHSGSHARGDCRESQDSSAHRFLCVPLDPTSVNVKSGVDVYVTRPTYFGLDPQLELARCPGGQNNGLLGCCDLRHSERGHHRQCRCQ
jgi:hypothetical protein